MSAGIDSTGSGPRSTPGEAGPSDPARSSRPSRWRRRIGHSLGLRLVLVFLVLAVALAVTFLGGMRTVFTGGWRDVVRPLIVDYVDRLATDIGSPPDVARAQALTQRLPITIRIDGPKVSWASHPQRQREFRARDTDWRESDGAWWLLTRETADGHRIRFGVGEARWEQRPRFVGWATLFILLMLTAAAYLYVRHLLHPLRDIRAGAVRFGRGEFSQPIAVRRRDELGDLAGQVNAMASSLHGMLEAKRQLLLSISHELRSPLTRARLNAELLPDHDENRSARDALLRDLAEMRDLVTDLLESERLSSGHAALHLEFTDLSELVRDVVSTHFENVGLTLEFDAHLPVLSLDRMRIRLLVRNLLDNALRHGSTANTPPVVSTRLADDTVTLTVRDFGPGVPDDHLPRLSEAFYRVDTARERATGGVGLGLHLCLKVVKAHGGRLTIRNAHPGLVVEASLPRSAPR